MTHRTLKCLSRLAALLLVAATTVAGQATQPELVWTLEDGGANWIGYYVSLGNQGTQVFAHESNYAMAGVLLSRHDGDPPVPAWTVPTWPANPVGCDSARDADVHVSLTATTTATPNFYTLELMTFSSQGAGWSYVYPLDTGKKAWVAVSDDGQTIVAALHNPVAVTTEVLVFDVTSAVPTAVHSLPAGVIWNFVLSGNGERAVVAIHDTAYVLDTSTGATLNEMPFSYSLSNVSFALSANGSLLVHGMHFAGMLRVFSWDGSTYQHAYYYSPVGSNPSTAIAAIAISDDDSTVAFGVNEGYPSTKVQTEAFDVATGLMTMSETVSSFGAWQNSCADLAISADGARFAVAQFGDQPDLVEEIRIFDRDDDVPIYTLNLPGSAFNVDISADGKWVVAGSKGVHANVLGSGGRYDLIHLGGADLRMTTTPALGNDVTFELYGPVGSSGTLLLSLLTATPPLQLQAGKLHLDPSSLFIVPIGPIGAAGTVTAAMRIPVDPILVGVSLYAQGLTVPPKRLTEDWIKLTFLP